MSTSFSSLVENAIRLASFWHKGQLRQESEFDYFTHPAGVAYILTKAGFGEEIVAAGYCHAVLRYTECSEEELNNACGREVLALVKVQTEKECSTWREWKEVKQTYIEMVSKAPWQIKALCTADRIHSLQSLLEMIYEYGLPYFEKFYTLPEDKLWFEDSVCIALQDTWDHPLVKEYDLLLNQFVDTLEKFDQGKLVSVSSFTHASREKVEYDEPFISKQVNTSYKSEETMFAPQYNFSKTNFSQKQYVSEEEHPQKKEKPKTVRLESIQFRYLSKEEASLLFPAALQLSISKGKITNALLQKSLTINYLTAFRILKEMKRLHVIPRADGVKPRKVEVTKAKELIKLLTK